MMNNELSTKHQNFSGCRTPSQILLQLLLLTSLFGFSRPDDANLEILKEDYLIDEMVAQCTKSQDLAAAAPKKEVFMPHGANLYQVLRSAGFTKSDTLNIIDASKEWVDVRNIKTGTQFNVYMQLPPIKKPKCFEIIVTPKEQIVINKKTPTHWTAGQKKVKTIIDTVGFTGIVKSSLWDSAEKSGMPIHLISDLADIFAWQIDFSREVKIGDVWRISVEREHAQGELIGWGRITTAEYYNNGRPFAAVFFKTADGRGSYYQPDGSSLRRLFLKSPMKFARVTSKFQRARYHPVLKVYRPHNGVDYGAPVGTPVMAVGFGTVEFAGRDGASGKVIILRHNSIYKTAYKHLNGFAPGIKRGSRVEQGQVLAYVGATGLVTGPHLHFAFYENDAYVDPLGLKFPSADPILESEIAQFQTFAKDSLSMLPPIIPQATKETLWACIDASKEGGCGDGEALTF